MFFFGLDRAVFLFLLSREGAGRAFAGLLQVQAWNISLFYSILKKKSKELACHHLSLGLSGISEI